MLVHNMLSCFLLLIPGVVCVVGTSSQHNSASGPFTASINNEKDVNGNAGLHKAFLIAGTRAGVEIWRVRDSMPVPLAQDDIGLFYKDESYIVLKTSDYEGSLSWFIHYWFGSKSPMDNSHAVVNVATELIDKFHHHALQSIELEGHESERFLGYFPNGIHYLSKKEYTSNWQIWLGVVVALCAACGCIIASVRFKNRIPYLRHSQFGRISYFNNKNSTSKNSKSKLAVVETHPKFSNVGKEAGVEIWKVQDFEPVPVSKSDFGKFCKGNSYVILKTSSDNLKNLSWDIHYWIGSESSLNDSGAVALLSVGLGDKLKGAAAQHRETEGSESTQFLTYFPRGFIIVSSS